MKHVSWLSTTVLLSGQESKQGWERVAGARGLFIAYEEALVVLWLPAHTLGNWVSSPFPLCQGFVTFYILGGTHGSCSPDHLLPHGSYLQTHGECQILTNNLLACKAITVGRIVFKGRFYM